MKRIRAASIFQTLVFSQKPELGLSLERMLQMNREEFDRYKALLDHARTRYVIVDESEQPDGSLVIHVKKQYNNTADVSEYF